LAPFLTVTACVFSNMAHANVSSIASSQSSVETLVSTVTTDTSVDLSLRPVQDLEGTDLEWSTVNVSTRKITTTNHTCMFCLHQFKGGPLRIATHLFQPHGCVKSVKKCMPTLQWVARKGFITAELKKRHAAKIAAKAAAVDLDDAKSNAKTLVLGPMDIFSQRPTVAAVEEALARTVAACGLTLHLVDHHEFRNFCTLVARGGQTLLTKDHTDVILCHRNKLTRKVLPALDAKLEDEVNEKIDDIIKEYGYCIISDSWTSPVSTSIINALACTPVASRLLVAMDCHGITKSMEWTASFIVSQAKKLGLEHTVACCMDGACKGAFHFINMTAGCEHIFCYVCPTHATDGFIGNVCENKAIVTVGSHGDEVEWGEDVFFKPIGESWDTIKWITSHGKALACFRDVAKRPDTWGSQGVPGFAEFVKYCDTRFASRVFMLNRYFKLRTVLEQFVVYAPFLEWLAKQARPQREAWAVHKKVIQSDEHWVAVELAIRCLEPAMVVMRRLDAKKGAGISEVYRGMLKLDALYAQPIDGLDDEIRVKIHNLFMARWAYFHQPVFTAAHFLDPQAIHHELSAEQRTELYEVFTKMATEEHSVSDLVADYANLRLAVTGHSHGMNEKMAFSERAKAMPPWQWADSFLFNFKHVCWAAKRILSLRCSASECEHSWSIEGWIHSAKRNRLGQLNVERLLRVHTNLRLESSLAEIEAVALEWDCEMIIDDPDDMPDSDDDE
jgi:hypothetical protein